VSFVEVFKVPMKCLVCSSADPVREKRNMPFTYRQQTTVITEGQG
jgi:hypothetical protein